MTTNLVRVADMAWRRAFVGGPYTIFKMVDFILCKSALSHRDLVERPKSMRQVKLKNFENEDLNGIMRSTRASNTGRCTSFALNIVSKLEGQYGNAFKFEMHDLKGHRVARCVKTGIVIDSSSQTGAFVLPNGEWRACPYTAAQWNWTNGVSEFISETGHLKTSSKAISQKHAMSLFLADVAARCTILTLFRSIENDRAKYHRMVFWDLQKKRIELTHNIENKGKKTFICWGQDGNIKSDEECRAHFEDFLIEFGGPHWETQWHADDIDKFNMALWEVSNELYGYPVFEE